MINRLITKVEESQLKKDIPVFKAGDNIKVNVRIREGNKQRIQIFEGLVIAKKNSGARETFRVRKISYGIGVERSFALHSPSIDKIEVVRRNKVRRSKIYYIRELRGKATRLKELKNIKKTS